MKYEEKTEEIFNPETCKREPVKMYRKSSNGAWLYVTDEMKNYPKSHYGYYAIDKDGTFTDSSPYEYRESAIHEAKEIHGNKFDYKLHLEEHITDAFYVSFLENI